MKFVTTGSPQKYKCPVIDCLNCSQWSLNGMQQFFLPPTFSILTIVTKIKYIVDLVLHWQNQCGNIGRVWCNKVNDLILEQLLAIILQTNLQSHQLFHADRQNTRLCLD